MNETLSAHDFSQLPRSEFAFPGSLRDRLIRAILDGRKVATTSLALEYEIGHETMPCIGQRSVVLDSDNQPVCVIETVEVTIVPLGEVDLGHVVDEGEGHATVSDWRKGHENFWRSREMVASLGGVAPILDDSTLVVLERFRVVERLRSTAS
ncbi:MAG TPA: ASCH domain-containing protein [Acidimicrobiales bacterium]|nr:ASCH domain-containing protein [Acidimicrobiales bacterium]